MKTGFKTILTFSLATMLISASLGVNTALNSFVKQAVELEENGEELKENKSEAYVFFLGDGGDGDDFDSFLVDGLKSSFRFPIYSFSNTGIKNVVQTFNSLPLYLINCSLKICF